MSNQGETQEHHISRGKVTMIAALLAVLIVAAWLAGYLPRRNQEIAAAEAANDVKTEIPLVSTAIVRQSAADVDLDLPGSVSALSEASIYSRATGYVRKRYVDIGDHVKEGQLLAEIDAPDLDQQVAQAAAAVSLAKQQLGQARAALIQAEAQNDLAKANLARYATLVKDGAVAQQDYETQVSGAKTAQALVQSQQANVAGGQDNVNQAQANLDRVIALQDFKKVRAPFAGVVTVRNVDVGYLISSSGGGQGTSPSTQAGATTPSLAFGNELFRVAQLGTLRIFVGVPQAAVASVSIGMPAAVMFADRPGQQFQAKVTRTASVLDPTARTMLTELQMPNADGKLAPGMYATVRFRQHRDTPPLLVRGDAIVTNGSGVQVALLSDSPRGQGMKSVHMAQVQSGRDYGTDVEIIGGLKAGDLVVVNPGDEIREGAVVRPNASGGRGASGR